MPDGQPSPFDDHRPTQPGQAPGAAPGPEAPPPGYGAPPPDPHGQPPYGPAGYGHAPAAPAKPFGGGAGLGLGLAIASIAAVCVGVFVKEDDMNLWDGSEVWSIFAIVAAAVTLAPAIGSSAGWGERRSWIIGAIGAAGLLAWWVLIVLPGIGSNLGFVNTVATVLGCAAVWLSDGRPDPDGGTTPTTW